MPWDTPCESANVLDGTVTRSVQGVRDLAIRGPSPGLPPPTDVSCLPHGELNLAATSVVHAGLPIAVDELRLDVLVANGLQVFSG